MATPGGRGRGPEAPGEVASLLNSSMLLTSAYFNNRLQPCRISVNSSGTPLSSCTASGVGNILDISYNFNPGADNGNVMSITNNIDNLRSQTFIYDTLNRLYIAQTNATYATSSTKCWGEQYSYDPWANLLGTASPSSYTGCTQESPGPGGSVNANNQLSADTYDAAGNLTAMPNGSSYSYDAENHLLSTAGVNYTYDGDGQRVEKSNGTIYWHGAGSDALDETNLSGTLTNEYIFFGGARIARRDPSSNVFYYFSDHLGTARAIAEVPSGQTTATKCYDADLYPYGGERWYTDTCDSHFKFTGKERDSESGWDNFGARYNASSLGRFMTPDSPSYSNHKNPQSWNLYAYSLNNPVTFRDADGHKIDCLNNTQQCQADAAAATGNAQAASQVTTQTTTTQHSFLGLFHWTTTETQIAITGDINAFRALSPNASKLADLVQSKDTISVSYDQYAKPSFWANGIALNGGSVSFTPSQGYAPQAFIDPTRKPGFVYDQDAVNQGIPQANTAEEFGHEVLGHIWGEMFGGAPAGTRANMRDSIIGEDAVRALDPARGQKGIESHHNYNEMPPDNYKPPQQ